jgi:hypothetical protein
VVESPFRRRGVFMPCGGSDIHPVHIAAADAFQYMARLPKQSRFWYD